jgi:agmatinase
VSDRRTPERPAHALRYLPSEDGFLALDGVDVEAAKAVVIPFGLEASVSYGGGTARGPQAMLKASAEVETFDDLFWCEPALEFGVATLEPVPIAPSIPVALEQLAAQVEAVVAAGKFPMVFGGEHSVTPGAIRPLLARHPDLILLHFDAHADLRDGYDGEHFSHASAIRRCLDAPNLEVVSVGIRNISAEGAAWLDANPGRVHMHWGRHRKTYDAEEICAPLAGRPVYITFDLDGLDAALMPATGTPEPGGLFWDDVMPILHQCARVAGRVVGADVNELAPIDGFHGPDFVAARLAYRIMSFALLDADRIAHAR